jgi:hypothetical protein
MLKASDKAITIESVRLLKKSGGKSGNWRAEDGKKRSGKKKKKKK